MYSTRPRFLFGRSFKEPFTFDELLYMLDETFEGVTTKMKADLHEILDLFLRYHLVYTET